MYLWIIPAKVEGTWEWTVNNSNFSADIEQEFQEINLTLESGGDSFAVSDVKLKGERISFIADNENIHYVYSGEVKGETITGYVQIHRSGDKTVKKWRAQRD